MDPLLGLKENVIIGKLIPAGTGMVRYKEETVFEKPRESENIEEMAIGVDSET